MHASNLNARAGTAVLISHNIMMLRTLALLLSAAVLLLHTQVCTGARDLSANYTFSATLDESYQLYWNYDLNEGSISFAVRVRTEGWVGFGVSPNGQMPGSDVVIGWVDDQGATFFHVSISNKFFYICTLLL